MAEIDKKTAGIVGSALLTVLNVYWAASTFAGVEETFSTFDLIAFSGMALAVTILEILVIALLSRSGHSHYPVLLVTAAFITTNAYCLNLVFVDAFMNLRAMKILSLLIGFL